MFILTYPINYGYIPGVLGGDGEELDVYLLGVDNPVKEYTARVIGIIHRHNDVEDKLVAAPEGIGFNQTEIAEAIHFQEQYYESEIETMPQLNFISKEPINKGWSCDKKYCVTTADGENYLLRVTPEEKSATRADMFHMQQRVAAFGVSMCKPVEYGKCDEGVYTVQTWVDGKDAAIRNAVLMDDSVLTDPTEMGKMVETAVYKHVAAFYYQKATRVGYYRGGKKDKEIDIVVDYPNINNILIEIKYRDQAPIKDNDAICELAGEASAAIVVTKRADDYGVHNAPNGKILLRIPAFSFLYLLGHAERHGYKGAE